WALVLRARQAVAPALELALPDAAPATTPDQPIGQSSSGASAALLRRHALGGRMGARASALAPIGSERLAVEFAADELVDRLASDIVAVLLGRGLHEVRGSRQDRARDSAVLGDLGGAHGVDDHAGRVR